MAYVFERFPTFTQTFCVREVQALRRRGLRPLLFSIRDTSDEPLEDHFPAGLLDDVITLPPGNELVEAVVAMKDADQLPQEVVLTMRHWGAAPDKRRIYEAAYIGARMREAGAWHAHTHFAGVGARTCWWLRRFYGMSYSFTGHANDIFEDSGCAVDLGRLVEGAALVVTVSDYTARYLKGRFPRAAGKVARVYNGLDLEPFARAHVVREDDPPLLVSVGRLIEKKGFDDLVRSCAHLRSIGAGPFRCVVVGDGPLEGDLRALIAELGVGELVDLVGAKSQPEIIDLLGRAAVFVLPCVTEAGGGKDNLPTVIAEAMAARLPCVSTRLAGVPEMVIEGETGLLVDERRPEEFAASVARLLADPELRRRMGEAGLRRAREVFSQDVSAAELQRLWRRCGALGKLGYWRHRISRLRLRKPSEFVLAERRARAEAKAGGEG